MFSVLFGGAVAVLPIYADQILHVGSMGLGFLRAAPSVGSVCVALVIAFRPMRVISGLTLLWVVAGFGASTLLFSVSTNFWLSLVFLMGVGAFDGVSMVIRSTILQLLTPENMRGRVSSVSSVFITSSNEIGAFESGAAARLMGLVPSVFFGGAMTLIVVALTAWLSPELRHTRIAHDQEADKA
jgi:predicted MFS family arabinose efflux permease